MFMRISKKMSAGACIVCSILALSTWATAAPYQLSADGNAVVRITPQGVAAPLNTSLITAAHPGWSVSNSAALNGAFTTSSYSADWQGETGGAQFVGNYAQAENVAIGKTLNYIQVINTNIALGGASSPYIDPQPNDDNLPFYWTASEAASFGGAKSISFSDFSKRAQSSLSSTNPINWSASLYPAIYDGAQSVLVGSGVEWGWTMKPATAGRAAAVFNSPTPACPPASCSGIGSATISWGTGQPGGLSFSGSEYAPKVGEEFKLGTLSYRNGATDSGSAINGIQLDIALAFDNVPELNFVYHAGMTINNTTNSSDPVASADYVQFAAGGFSAAFHVLEGASATADLLGKLTPLFAITPSFTADKDPFGTPDTISLVGYQLQLTGLANASAGGFVTAIAVPGTLMLLLTGLAGAQLARRKQGAA